jgi:glycosyltransferase involved in cell wall biosynthesis
MRQFWSDLFPVIGIDATYSVGRSLTGVGRYSRELLRALRELQPEVEWRQYYRPKQWLRAEGRRHLLWDFFAPGVDLFHGLNQRLPKRTQSPTVVTFHDLFVLSAEYSTPEFRQRFAQQARDAASRADRIIAVSRFTANQVAELLEFPESRIRVVPHGVHTVEQTKPIEQRRPVILTVGAVQKRKNTARLVEAFRTVPEPWELWIAGSLGYGAEEVVRKAEVTPRVKLLGYVPDAKLQELYRQASIFAFPSLDEGFGMPVLEAMAHGVPVLTSTTSSLPEVAGEAAVLADPYSVESVREGLLRLLEVDVRRHYAALGRERAVRFSWRRAAEQTWAVYEELLR